MATFDLGNVPSPIQQAMRLAQLREIQNPNLALERDIQRAIQLQAAQQQTPQAQLALKIQEAALQKAQNELDPAYQEAQFQKELQKAAALYGMRPQLSTIVNADGTVSVIDKKARTATGVTQAGGDVFSTGIKETFSTVPTDQGLVRVGSRSTEAVPLRMGGEQAQAPKKAVNVRQFTDANGFLFEQPLTGGTPSPVPNPITGGQMNTGVANQIFSTDQGFFTAPKKTEGGAASPSPTALTTPARTPLTRTTGGKGTAASEAGAAFASATAQSGIAVIDELLPKIGPTTVGFGALAKDIPTTGALDFAAGLDQLKSTVLLSTIQEMKNASKTGASGLGQVSNREGKILESVQGSLDQRQSQESIRNNLTKVKASLQRWEEAKQKYGTTSPVRATSREQYDALAPGTRYIDSKGNVGTKK